MATVGDNLRILRMERGMTQEDIANRLNITRFSVANYETNRREPGIALLQKYAEAFNTSIDELTNTNGQANVTSLMELAERVFSDDTLDTTEKETLMSELMKCYLKYKDKGSKKGSR